MIYYLTAAKSAGEIGIFLQTWGKALASRIRILSYEWIFSGSPVTLTRGVYIFTTLGRTLGRHNPPTRERLMIARLYQDLAGRFGPDSVINDPLSPMRRLELLRMLRERGFNRFAAYPVDDLPRTARFPVFLRGEDVTQWEHVPLLHDREEYQAALASDGTRNGLIAVEFCDTSDSAGIYRKYGAFVVGGHIVPRHLFFSRQWLVKNPELTEPEHVAEELAYLEANPHAELLREVCRLANIGYGRIDYSLFNGRVQIWEINKTPLVSAPPQPSDAVRYRVHQRFAELLAAALDAIDISGA